MPYYLAISLLRIQFTKRYSSSLCKNLKLETTQMPIASKLNLLRYIHTEKYYVMLRMDNVQLSAAGVINLTDMMLRGKSHTRRTHMGAVPFL